MKRGLENWHTQVFSYYFLYIYIERLGKVILNFLRNYFTLTIVLMAIAALKIGIL